MRTSNLHFTLKHIGVATVLIGIFILFAISLPAAAKQNNVVKGGHKSAFVCTTPSGSGPWKYRLNRSKDQRIDTIKKNDHVVIEYVDGSEKWIWLGRKDVRVFYSKVPVRAVHGIGVDEHVKSYTKVADLQKNRKGLYKVPSYGRTKGAVLTSPQCR